MTSPARLRSEAGFTLFEMLVSTGLIVLITGSVFSLLNPSYGTFQAQPEVSDMQQRLRVAADSRAEGPGDGRRRHLLGLHGRHARQLLRADPAAPSGDRQRRSRRDRFAPTRSARPKCASAITIMYVPNTNSQTTIRTDMPTPSPELKVVQQPGCGEDDRDLCGFNDFDRRADHRTPAAPTHIHSHQHAGQRAAPAAPRRQVHAEVLRRALDHEMESHTYYLNECQHRHYDSGTTTATSPTFRSPTTSSTSASSSSAPRCRRSSRPVSDRGPWTKSGPKPPTIGTDNNKDSWDSAKTVSSMSTGRRAQVARPQIQTLGTAPRWSGAIDRQHAHRRPLVPVGDQRERRRHAEQVRRRPAARSPGPRDPARAGGQRGSAGSRRRLFRHGGVRAAPSASCRTRKSASTSRRAT